MTDIIKEQFKLRIYTEGIVRINKVLDMLTEEQVWYSPNNNINSVGNLVLHLNGNVTQWIGTGVAQHKDVRQRESILIHVIEHFSYHVGQIAYLGKLITDRDLGFYEGMDLAVID